jgi:hypothetical protein
LGIFGKGKDFEEQIEYGGIKKIQASSSFVDVLRNI